MLHLSRSLHQFRALSKRAIRAWKLAGEEAYADWFQDMYLTPRWEGWFVNGSSIPGFLPTQQPIEAHHRVIKVIVSDFKNAPTGTVLNSVLPRILLYDTDGGPQPVYRHYCEGPLPTESVVKAAYLIQVANHQEVFPQGDRKNCVQLHEVDGEINILCGSCVTTDRRQKFILSLSGRLGPRSPINTASFNFLSLQNVAVDRARAINLPYFFMVPTWQLQDVESITCTCKRYMHSGWVCAHVIASLSLMDKLDLSTAMQPIPMQGPPGRPRQIGGPLDREDPSSDDFFSVNKLLP